VSGPNRVIALSMISMIYLACSMNRGSLASSLSTSADPLNPKKTLVVGSSSKSLSKARKDRAPQEECERTIHVRDHHHGGKKRKLLR